MQYSRLIDAILDECIAAFLGGYDVRNVLAARATGGDLVREMLVHAASDPRFNSSVHASKAWRTTARTRLESFAQEVQGIDRQEALERLEAFLADYFIQMVGWSGVLQRDARVSKKKGLQEALAELDGESEEIEAEASGKRPGEAITREEERRAELRFLRSIPPSLRELARRIGRTGQKETGRGRFPVASKSDIAGITVGDDLNCLLPSEIALLAGRETEDVFFHKFVGKRLQVFASASSAREPVFRQDGPVIVCLDRSGSMEGPPSDLARALTMAVVILAKRRRREVVVVKYGNGQEDAYVVKNLRKQRKDLIRFLSYHCDGGNNENSMFRMVFQDFVPQEKDFSAADVLCVSDFGWANVGVDVMDLIRANKAKGMRFYGLDVFGAYEESDWCHGDGRPSQIIDSMWIWDGERNLCYEDEDWKSNLTTRP